MFLFSKRALLPPFLIPLVPPSGFCFYLRWGTADDPRGCYTVGGRVARPRDTSVRSLNVSEREHSVNWALGTSRAILKNLGDDVWVRRSVRGRAVRSVQILCVLRSCKICRFFFFFSKYLVWLRPLDWSMTFGLIRKETGPGWGLSFSTAIFILKNVFL